MPDLSWQDFDLCGGMPTNIFFDYFEEDKNLRPVVKGICALCPVRRQCGAFARTNGEHGVWGGDYYEYGVPIDK